MSDYFWELGRRKRRESSCTTPFGPSNPASRPLAIHPTSRYRSHHAVFLFPSTSVISPTSMALWVVRTWARISPPLGVAVNQITGCLTARHCEALITRCPEGPLHPTRLSREESRLRRFGALRFHSPFRQDKADDRFLDGHDDGARQRPWGRQAGTKRPLSRSPTSHILLDNLIAGSARSRRQPGT